MSQHISLKHMLAASTLLTVAAQGHNAIAQETQTTANNTSPFTQEEGEKMVFDIYVAQKLQGTAIATFTDQWVKIENPQDVLAQIPNVKNESVFAPFLNGKIPANTTKIESNIGQVRVEPANFAIYLDIDESQAQLSKLSAAESIKATEDTWSLQNAMRLNTVHDSGTNTGDAPYTVSHVTSFGNGPWRATLNGVETESETYQVENAVVEYDHNATRYSAGLLTTQGTDFVGSVPYYGVKITDNYRQLTSLENFQATPVEIFVPSRAKVRIFKNGSTLIYNKTHDFGFQQIPTESFPSGSYELTIKIEEQDGDTTEERRAFHKDGALSAFDHPTYNFQIGILRDDFSAEDGFIVQGDYAWRLSDATEAEVSLYGNDSLFTFEPKLKLSLEDYYITSSLSVTSKGDTAVKGLIQYRPPRAPLQWNASVTQTLSGHQDASSITEFDDITLLRAREQTNFSGGISYRYKDLTFSASGSYSKYEDNDANYAYGPRVLWNVFNNTEHRVQAEARLIRTQDASDGAFVATYRYTPQKSNWQYSSSGARLGTGTKYKNEVNQQVTYNNQDENQHGLNLTLFNNYLHATDRDINIASVATNYNAQAFSLDTEYEYRNESVGDNEERLDLTLASNIIITKNGMTQMKDGEAILTEDEPKTKVAFTSKENISSGVIIDLTGNATGTPVKVLVNNRIAATTTVGQRVTINIPEYQKSIIKIEPTTEAGLLHFSDDALEITLYPDNIYHKEWRINKMALAMGRLIGVDGKPIAWEKIHGLKGYTTTDASGYFQMEITGNETPYVSSDNTSCTMALPRVRIKNMLNNLGDIICG